MTLRPIQCLTLHNNNKTNTEAPCKGHGNMLLCDILLRGIDMR